MRDGKVAWLPDALPQTAAFDWTAELSGNGIGGIAVGAGCVVVGSRDILDRNDVFQCFDINTGTLLWQHFYTAPGQLDYGNSPRATPLIHADLVYTLGAFGHLYCLELETGLPLWQRNIAQDFSSPEMTWGHSGSPLIADGKLIVQPGGKQASIVALNPESGDVIWKTPGIAAGYSSFIAGTFGGVKQIIGSDAMTLGGWELNTGKRVWTLIPPVKGDFMVPTAVPFGDEIIVASENNGTRRYRFSDDGVIVTQPVAQNEDLKPDSHTPVVCGNYVFGIWNELYGADLKTMTTKITNPDDAFAVYGCLVCSDDQLLSLTQDGELILMSLNKDRLKITSRLALAEPGTDVLSHPAIAGDSIYLRINRTLMKLPLLQR
ncbi:MAG: PQQ-binding-like beta-propeller repeat protein [Fuerstiella sp.]